MPSSSLPSSPPSSPIPEKQSSQHDKPHSELTTDERSAPGAPHNNPDENVKLERSGEREENDTTEASPSAPPEILEAVKDKPQFPSAEEKQIAHLHSLISNLTHQITQKRTALHTTTSTLSSHSSSPASAIVEQHIKLLHHYNEIRDIGQGLMGIVAANRGCRVKDIYEELGVGEND